MDLVISLAHFCEEHGPRSIMSTRMDPAPCSSCPSPSPSSPDSPQSPASEDPWISPNFSGVQHHMPPSFSRRKGAPLRPTLHSNLSAHRDEMSKASPSPEELDLALKRLPGQLSSSSSLHRHTGELSLAGVREERGCASCTMVLPLKAKKVEPDSATLRTKMEQVVGSRKSGSTLRRDSAVKTHSPIRDSLKRAFVALSPEDLTPRPNPMNQTDPMVGAQWPGRDGFSSSSSTSDDYPLTPPLNITDSGIAMSDSEELTNTRHPKSELHLPYENDQWRPVFNTTVSSEPSPHEPDRSHIHTLNYLSERYPPTDAQNSILRRACTRIFSCETMQNHSPAGAVLFGDAQAGYAIAHMFKLRDERARGGYRPYAFLCVGSKDLDLMMRLFTPITRSFRNQIDRITALSDHQTTKRSAEASPDSRLSSRPDRRQSLATSNPPTPLSAGFTVSSPPSPFPPSHPPSAWMSHARRFSNNSAPIRDRPQGQTLTHQRHRTVPVGLTEMLGKENFFVQMHAEFVKYLVQLGQLVERDEITEIRMPGTRRLNAGRVGRRDDGERLHGIQSSGCPVMVS